MNSIPFSVILGNVGACSDRYVNDGYAKQLSIEEMFEKVASIEQVTGVELVSNWHLRPDNVELIRRQLQQYQLKLVSVIPDHFGTSKWKHGSFSAKNSDVREDAVKVTQEMMDICADLGGSLISLWPGQDGYDYHFQADYEQERRWFVEGVSECAQYRQDVNLAIEYKPKEPRNHCYASNLATTLLMVHEIDSERVGVTIDFGHGLMAYENLAESVAMAHHYGNKLFHVHMNDAYGYWDDDMICGSIHTIHFLELFYWLNKTNYHGYISTDQYPYREDGRDAVQESIRWMDAFAQKIKHIGMDRIEKVIQSGNAVEASRLLRFGLFGME